MVHKIFSESKFTSITLKAQTALKYTKKKQFFSLNDVFNLLEGLVNHLDLVSLGSLGHLYHLIDLVHHSLQDFHSNHDLLSFLEDLAHLVIRWVL